MAKTRGIYELVELSENVTKLTMIRQNVYEGAIPNDLLEEITHAKIVNVKDLHAKYARCGKVVDVEVRTAIAERMRNWKGELTEDQKEIFRKCERLSEGEAWKDMKSPASDVKMSIQFHQQEKGERSIATGRAEGIADCTAEEACAWLYNFCSNDRMDSSREEGNPAHIEVSEGLHSENMGTFAMVKKMPFIFRDREFVIRYIWRVDRKKSRASVAIWPASDAVDYGGKQRKSVRAVAKGLFVATNIVDGTMKRKRCLVVYYQVRARTTRDKQACNEPRLNIIIQ